MSRTTEIAGTAVSAGERSLEDWGWDERWAAAFVQPLPAMPARVVAQHRGAWVVAARDGDHQASPTGRFRRDAAEGELPVVGDWVACLPPVHGGEARIDAVLPRRTAFARRAPGSRLGVQVVAANIDTLFIATSLNRDLNPRRLERYVAMARESGAEAVVLVTKVDLAADDPAGALERLAHELGVAVAAVSSVTGEGIEGIEPWLRPGRTIALVGSSGVGKSTLLNRLAGADLMTVREIREDDARGRHTTTHRALFRLLSGVLVLDTPGMRELGLWDADEGLDETFGDIADLATRCRFADCSHEREPGCAVRAAIERGEIDARRLRSYRRLSRELAEQPSPRALRDERRRFARAVSRASEASMARKTYRETS